MSIDASPVEYSDSDTGETNFQCSGILIFYFADLLKVNTDKKKTGKF